MSAKKKFILGIIAYISVAIILNFLSSGLSNQTNEVLMIISRAMVVLIIIFFILSAFYVQKRIKKDNEFFKEKVSSHQYNELITIYKNKIDKYFYGRLIINAKYSLLVVFFITGRNKEAFDLLNTTKWRVYKKNVLYFKILELLYKNMLEQANELIIEFRKNKSLADEIYVVDAILDLKKNGNIAIDYKRFSYPLVRDMFSTYE